MPTFKNLINIQVSVVVEISGQVVGFAELESTEHVDCFYCHRGYQRRGVGSVLLQHVKAESTRQVNQKMFAEVSVTARPFFERQSFCLIREQEVTVRGVTMTNFVMELELRN